MEEDTEYMKLPVDEKVVHKLWKARLNGYEEVTKLFRQQDDDKSPEFQKYLGLVKKFVVDSNAVAQEKGLEAALAYVESYALAGKTAGEVVSGIIGKCIAAPKTRTKELAVQIILMYIEAEKQEVVQEELIKGMEHKNPKISAACVACTTQALREFGSKVITIKTLVKKISTLLEDRDKSVREEGKAMVVEMYRWVGAALKPQLANLKPVQVSELEAEFEKVKPGQAQPTRYLRSQQEKQAKMAVEIANEDGEGGDETEEAAPADVDPLELVDPVDILSQLPKDFYEKLESKKWQERKESVDILEKLVQAPKLEAGDYGELVRFLKKIIAKDSNVVVVGVAGKCLAGLASGLKKKFSPYASACIPTVLEKFKEKKVNVVTAMREASDAIYVSSSIESIQEDVLVALESKNPQVKLETASFLARCFTKCTPTLLNKKLLKAYVTILLKMLNDPDPLVRDNAAEALGTAMKVVGEKSMAPLINDVEAAKQNKIRECCEKAVVVAVKVRPVSAPVKKVNEPKPVARPNTATITVKRAVVKKPAAQAINSATVVRSKVVPKAQERELSQEEVDERAMELFTEATISEMADSNYKVRLAAVEQFIKVVNGMEESEKSAQLLLRILNKKPGFKDNNFQVLKVRLEAAKMICETTKLSSTAVGAVLTDIAGSLGDPKTGAVTAQVLSCLAEGTSLDAIATPVMDFVWSQKSPKMQAEALLWLSGACEEFGLCLEMSTVSDWVKKGMASTVIPVRTAALAVVNSLVPFVGEGMAAWFSSEKPNIQQQIQLEIDKREGDVAPTATRVQASQPTVSPTRQREGPLIDISELITDQLIGQLQDKNWKERMEALQKVEKLVSGKKITNNLGELPQMLTSRLVDSNSKIAAEAMSICQALATSLGRHGSIHLRSLFPTIVLGLGDSKPLIRKAATACLNSWGEHCGWEEFFSGEMLADAFKTGSPQLRADLWAWLLAVFETLAEREEGKPLPKEELKALLPHLYANVEDRNPEVRKVSVEVILPIMTHLGYRIMLDAADKLKPGSKSTVVSHLDHARGDLPRDTKENVREQPSKMTGGGDAKARPKTAGTQKKVVSAVKPTSRGKKEEESDVGPLLQANNLKQQRAIDEMKLKVLKWVFTTPRDEFIELLRDQLTTANANKTLITHMFHADFKYHLKAIEMLTEDFRSSNKATIANLDLILKWMTLRFFDTNPSVLLKGLDYLQAVFESLSSDDPPHNPVYQLTDFEASSFIPYLLIKIGDPKDAVRSGVKSLFYSLAIMYPHSKLFSLIMDGLKSKNARQRTECLDLLAYFIGQYPVMLTTSLKEIARHIADRDNSVRNAALNCVVKAYQKEGDRTYKMIGQLSDKEMSLLEERIKRADKAKRTMPPMQPKQAQQLAPPRAPEPEEEEEEEEEEDLEPYCPPPTTYTSSVSASHLSETLTLNSMPRNPPHEIKSPLTAYADENEQSSFVIGVTPPPFNVSAQESSPDSSKPINNITYSTNSEECKGDPNSKAGINFPTSPCEVITKLKSRLTYSILPSSSQSSHSIGRPEPRRLVSNAEVKIEMLPNSDKRRTLLLANHLNGHAGHILSPNPTESQDPSQTVIKFFSNEVMSPIKSRRDELKHLPAMSTPVKTTAVVKPSVSGPFGLDFELLERIEGAGLELHAPQLAEFDLNDILNDEPPMIPKAISSESRSFPPTLTPPKPLQRINTCSNESQTIDLVLSCISSIDHTTANLAMTQLDTLMQSDMAALMVTKADTFVMAAVMQLRLLHQASSVTAQPEQLAKTYRTLMMLLITFYKNPGLAERVSKNSIRDLMEQFLHLLVEERLQELDNGTTFIRVTNMLVVKVIEKSDRTAITCALIKILHESVGNLNTSPRFIELVMKCLWKVVKMLPGWGQQLEYHVVLLETHLFLKAYPTTMWKKRSSGNDMPLRTIKTILHTMVKMKGGSIMQELDLVDNSQDSELAVYLNKLIRAPSPLLPTFSNIIQYLVTSDNLSVKAVKQEPSPQQRLTKSTHEQLSEVFRKIGSKDQTQEGLSNLYDFRVKHPEADIEPFLSKSSEFFQKYIAEGMQAIERDRAAQADNTERPVHSDTEKSASYYMSRLRNLQQMAGLQESGYVTGLPTNRDDDLNQNNQLNEDKQELSSILRSPNSTTVANLDSIRQRLDRVKSTALRDESS